MFTQRESLKLGNMLQKADILLSHDSMYHLIGKDKLHLGLLGIDLYNLKNRVKLNICRHYHTATVKKRFGTTAVCVFRCALITFPDISVEYIF